MKSSDHLEYFLVLVSGRHHGRKLSYVVVESVEVDRFDQHFSSKRAEQLRYYWVDGIWYIMSTRTKACLLKLR